MHTHADGFESSAQTEGRLIRWASFYDVTVNIMTLGQAGRLRRMTVDQAPLQPGESVLDVGCGTGGVTIPAKMRVGRNGIVAGIDPSPEMIAVARRRAGRAGVEIDFRVGVIESLPFPDGTFDLVTASLMMHHLPEHLQVKGLAEIWRVLRSPDPAAGKPAGRLLVADMMRPSPNFLGHIGSLILHHGHSMQFGIEDLPRLLRDAGFENMEQLDARFLSIGFVRAQKSGS
jgi:ubiquinone/menaquinone biosynthesis C-methylase UbiE